MRLRILISKRKVDDPYSNTKKLALCEPTLTLTNEIKIIDYHVVNDETQMRPDLIALNYYGTEDGLDIILKYNGISNPYSLEIGQILSIPDKASATTRYRKPKKLASSPRAQFVDGKRLSEKDKKRQEFLRSQSEKKENGSKQNLPPNMLKEGEKTKIIQNDRILLGANLKVKKK